MAKTNYNITQAQVMEHLQYDAMTGELRWLSDGHKRKTGDLVPSDASVINILGSSYSKLKLVWLLINGEWPSRKVNTSDVGSKDLSTMSVKGLPMDINQAIVQDALGYNPDTGIFVWRKSKSSTGCKGSVAGCLGSDGYWKIRLSRKLHLAHRLAFLYMTGTWPGDLVDHRDGNRSNNAWENIRPANASENGQNRMSAQSNSSTGMLGVYWSKSQNAWFAKVNVDGRQFSSGMCQSMDEALQAHMELKSRLHPFNVRDYSVQAHV